MNEDGGEREPWIGIGGILPICVAVAIADLVGSVLAPAIRSKGNGIG